MPERPSSGQWEQLWLPLWPYASDELWRGIYRTSRGEALTRRYIQANPDVLSNLLVVDIDHADAFLRAGNARCGWTPNAVVENRANGHAHAVWALSEPVTRTEYARRKPLAYAAAVVEGLRRSVDGDKAYSGLMTKNPVHDAWDATWLTDRLYSLPELEDRLHDAGDMPPPGWTRTRRANPVGLGRNCAIFESARTWAYRKARLIRLRHEYPTAGDTSDLCAAISAEVHTINAGYTEPLPDIEARAIAASIHRWIVKKFYGWTDSRTVNTATFIAIQSARGRKSGQARRAAWQQILDAESKGNIR